MHGMLREINSKQQKDQIPLYVPAMAPLGFPLLEDYHDIRYYSPTKPLRHVVVSPTPRITFRNARELVRNRVEVWKRMLVRPCPRSIGIDGVPVGQWRHRHLVPTSREYGV